MTDPVDFSDIELAAGELNIFVLGPGYGEAVVIDLPGPGWLVIDGAGRRREFPVHELLSAQLDRDVVDALLLTHPHLDHYRGMRELLDHPQLGPRIRRVGCVERMIEDPPAPERHSFGVEAQAQIDPAFAPLRKRDFGKARTLLERIQTFWDMDRARRLPLVRGPLQLMSSTVEAEILAPDEAQIAEFFRPQGRTRRIRDAANELSVVLELRFGEGRFVFPGDLPEPAWRAVLDREQRLNEHDLLKIPHHGSEGAQPDDLLRPRKAGPRTWVLTPFNRGRKRSRPPTVGGLSGLLEHEPALHLTAFPVPWAQLEPTPAQIGLDDLEPAPVNLGRSVKAPKGGKHPGRTSRALRQRDCFWLFCFDEAGRMTRSCRGPASTRLQRSGSPSR